MKALKIIGGVLAVLLIIPALMPSQFEVERSVQINSSQEEAFSYLVNLESWKEWSPWFEEEPQAEVKFEGVPGVVGSSQSWDGEVIGAGRQILSEVRQPEYIEYELEFSRPASPPATSSMKIDPQAEGVEVTWAMQGGLNYPLGRVFGLLMPGFIGKKFEEGLANLKKKLEQGEEPVEDSSQ